MLGWLCIALALHSISLLHFKTVEGVNAGRQHVSKGHPCTPLGRAKCNTCQLASVCLCQHALHLMLVVSRCSTEQSHVHPQANCCEGSPELVAGLLQVGLFSLGSLQPQVGGVLHPRHLGALVCERPQRVLLHLECHSLHRPHMTQSCCMGMMHGSHCGAVADS